MRLQKAFPILGLSLLTATLVTLAFSTLEADASDGEGIDVEVCVIDTEGQPIAIAVLRNPLEEERHPVNTATGCWTGNVFYLPTGEVLTFKKGLVLELEISASGYTAARAGKPGKSRWLPAAPQPKSRIRRGVSPARISSVSSRPVTRPPARAGRARGPSGTSTAGTRRRAGPPPLFPL